MQKDELDLIAFQIIANSGEARTLIHVAFDAMRKSDYETANCKLKEAEDFINKAHQAQTDLLHAYANEESMKMEIIMIHAQDHMMTTMTLKEVAHEMMHLYERIDHECKH